MNLMNYIIGQYYWAVRRIAERYPDKFFLYVPLAYEVGDDIIPITEDLDGTEQGTNSEHHPD